MEQNRREFLSGLGLAVAAASVGKFPEAKAESPARDEASFADVSFDLDEDVHPGPTAPPVVRAQL